MKSGIVLNGEEVKKIIAEHFEVSEENVIKAKYSYIIIDAKGKHIIKDK